MEYSFSVKLEADPLGGVILKLALMLVIKVWNIWRIKNGINMDENNIAEQHEGSSAFKS